MVSDTTGFRNAGYTYYSDITWTASQVLEQKLARVGALFSLDYGNGDSVEYTYDEQGRVIKETYEDGDTVTYTYDSAGGVRQGTVLCLDENLVRGQGACPLVPAVHHSC